jgi:hypothetical protein
MRTLARISTTEVKTIMLGTEIHAGVGSITVARGPSLTGMGESEWR